MIVGTAQEAETVGQDFQRSLAEHQPVQLHPLFQDLENQILLLDAGDVGQVFLAGLLDQLRHAHPLQFGDVDVALLDLLVPIVGVVGFLDAACRLFGQLFGQAQRFAIDRRIVVLVGRQRSFGFANTRTFELGHDPLLLKGKLWRAHGKRPRWG